MQLNKDLFRCTLPTCKYTNICMQQTKLYVLFTIIERIHGKQPMARLYKQNVEAQFGREHF